MLCQVIVAQAFYEIMNLSILCMCSNLFSFGLHDRFAKISQTGQLAIHLDVVISCFFSSLYIYIYIYIYIYMVV